MLHKKIHFQKDISHEIMEELGNLDDCLHFVNLNLGNKNKFFSDYIERCDECLKDINYFENIILLHGLNLIKYNSYLTFKIDLQNDKDNCKRNGILNYFDEVETEIKKDKKICEELIEKYNIISNELDLLIEKKSVFDKVYNLIGSKINFNEENNDENNLINFSRNSTPKPLNIKLLNNISDSLAELNFISGVIRAEDDLKFKKIIFRISHGNLYPFFYDLSTENKSLHIQEEKKIFIVIISRNNLNLNQKLMNICEIFNANRFMIPQNKEELNKSIISLQQKIFDEKTNLKKVEISIKELFKNKLGEDGVPGKYDLYKFYFIQEKMIYENLNKCKKQNDFLDGEIWIPNNKYDLLNTTLNKISINNENNNSCILMDFIENDDDLNFYKKPPTYFKLNDFSKPFQLMIYKYAIPRYQEINPALFSIVTFPFLFGIMFGDIGHGGLLILLGFFLIYQKYEILKKYNYLNILVKNRYFILLLGFFTFYIGIIYNDFFSLPLNFFGSCYETIKINGKIEKIKKEDECIYPIGLDPKWHMANNELIFLNSFKMKVSIIIGIIHMLFGLFLKGLNHIYFREYLDLFFVFLPQFIFMSALFGYLIFLIFIKWGSDWTNNPSQAPSIISQFFSIFLNYLNLGNFSSQESIYFYILIICICCILIMLLIKPFLEYFKKIKKLSLVELFMNQLIETLEFILSTVSHTASYLRLWALSLAHGELTKIFFEITMLGYIQSGNIFGMMFGFVILYHITLIILMGIDLIECAFHSLRLHWIEFQRKFFYADGYLFTPFCFKYIFDDLY